MEGRYDDLQRQIDQLVAAVKSSRDDIDGLMLRADAAERRADLAQDRADDLSRRGR